MVSWFAPFSLGKCASCNAVFSSILKKRVSKISNIFTVMWLLKLGCSSLGVEGKKGENRFGKKEGLKNSTSFECVVH